MPDKFDNLSKEQQKRLAKKYNWEDEDVIVRPPTKAEKEKKLPGIPNRP